MRTMIGNMSVVDVPGHLSLASIERDPVLRTMPFLKNRRGSDFRLTEEHARRLDALWRNKDKAWSRDELVVALQVGRLDPRLAQHGVENAPVIQAAILLGRTTSAVAAQAKMFLDLAADYCGTPAPILAVWNEFVAPDSDRINEAKLDAEFVRISTIQRAI